MKKKPKKKPKKRSETPLLDMFRNDPNRITEEGVIYFHGVPIYSFWSMPKACLKCGFEKCCCGRIR